MYDNVIIFKISFTLCSFTKSKMLSLIEFTSIQLVSVGSTDESTLLKIHLYLGNILKSVYCAPPGEV